MNIIKTSLTLILVILFCSSNSIFAQCSHEEREGKLLGYCNNLRSNPKQFLKDIVMPYLRKKGYDTVKNKYVTSLIMNLKKQKPVQAMAWNSYLHGQAHEFALDMGMQGATGHYSKNLGDLEKRLKKYPNGYTGENCSYGYNRALDILMQLLIDEDVPSLGHRKNLLRPAFNEVGIAIEPHIEYGWNCVMDFGGAERDDSKKYQKKSLLRSIFAYR